MANANLKKQYRVDNKVVSLDQARIDKIYSVYWIDDNDIVQKIEMMDDLDAYKVIFADQETIFETPLAKHQKNYPDIDIEYWTSKQKIAENSFKFDATHFNAKGELTAKTACIEDATGKLLSETEYSPSGVFVNRSNYIYDDNNKLIRVEEFDSFGHKISELEMS